MVQVKEATYVPVAGGGGQIQAVVTVGNQEVRSALPIGSDDAFLQSLLDDLEVRIEKVTYVPGPGRREIHVTMTLGGRSYISRIPFDEGDPTIGSSMDRLLQAVGTRFVRTMESSLSQGEVDDAARPEPVSAPGDEPA
jgi:hypothetical protein